MVELIKTREELSSLLKKTSLAQGLGLVPTMGALHEGHLSLVKLARNYADKVMVSIYVNPLQFGKGEDFDQYPRTLETDLELLEGLADYVWAPNYQDIYPSEPVNIPADSELANKLCGLSRPGHFDGVCTVVKALCEAVQPQYAILGEKDFQQLIIIEEMIKHLDIPVKIIRAPIMREESGLAMSSRNQYLSEPERKQAAAIYTNLQAIANKKLSIEAAISNLSQNKIKTEYLEVHWGRLFFAGKLGKTRLIDNIALDFS